jgi:UrcA family protein
MIIVNSYRGFIAAAIAGATLMSGSLPAVASDLGPPVVVKYNDVDPSSAQGAAILYKRIRVAAVSICSPVDHGTPLSRQHEQACVQKVVARAVTDVGSAALSAVYAANYGGPVPNTITASR